MLRYFRATVRERGANRGDADEARHDAESSDAGEARHASLSYAGTRSRPGEADPPEDEIAVGEALTAGAEVVRMTLDGAVAQLGARLNGIQEVGGSIPPSSTPEGSM